MCQALVWRRDYRSKSRAGKCTRQYWATRGERRMDGTRRSWGDSDTWSKSGNSLKVILADCSRCLFGRRGRKTRDKGRWSFQPRCTEGLAIKWDGSGGACLRKEESVMPLAVPDSPPLLRIFFSTYYIACGSMSVIVARRQALKSLLCIFNLSTLLDTQLHRVKGWLFNLWPTHGDGTSFWKWNPCFNRGLSALWDQESGSQSLWFHKAPSVAPCNE